MNDVTVWPGSSTSPPSDPRRGTVWYGLAANGLAANGLAANGASANGLAANRGLRVFISFTKIDYLSILVKEMSLMGTIFMKMAVFLK